MPVTGAISLTCPWATNVSNVGAKKARTKLQNDDIVAKVRRMLSLQPRPDRLILSFTSERFGIVVII